MLVYRDFVTYYKQTILGPIWFFIQPIFTAAINLFVFGGLADVGPEGVPGFVFYLSGPIMWQYFQDAFIRTSSTFIENQALFSKVYFPRLVIPIAIILSGLLKFTVQLGLLILAIIIYYIDSGVFVVRQSVVFFPIVLIFMMIYSLGFGLLVSAITTKYRDVKFFIDFSIPLLKYITPGIATSMVIYYQSIPREMHSLIKYNPIGYLVDGFNFMFVGVGHFDWVEMLWVFLFACLVLISGIALFNQTEKTFMDTV
jgi:lipopolysaccharide transport system permease protein